MGRPALPLTIREDDLEHPAVRALLALHLERMRGSSPPEFSFALDVSGLTAPGMTVWTAWMDEALAGIVALKTLGAGVGELKSMRVADGFLRRGVGRALLEQVIVEARRRGLTRLSLETGDGPAFEAALGLYLDRGFIEGEAFADYASSPFNRFLHLDL